MAKSKKKWERWEVQSQISEKHSWLRYAKNEVRNNGRSSM